MLFFAKNLLFLDMTGIWAFILSFTKVNMVNFCIGYSNICCVVYKIYMPNTFVLVAILKLNVKKCKILPKNTQFYSGFAVYIYILYFLKNVL